MYWCGDGVAMGWKWGTGKMGTFYYSHIAHMRIGGILHALPHRSMLPRAIDN